MKNQVILTVKQNGTRYKVEKMVNSVQWDVGSHLSKNELEIILNNRAKPTKVIVN